VQNALRQARLLGLLNVKERRIPGVMSLPNIITVASREWASWLKLGGQHTGLKMLSATDNQYHSKGAGLETDRLTTWQRKAIVAAYERCASPPRRSRRL
jgi:hypothetical protein